MIPPKFCHLHLHTEYSMLDGLGTPSSYAKKAAELGFKYLAITDHGNIDGLIEFQKSCNKHGIKPILGCEAYIVSDALEKRDKKRGHILLLVKNKKGFKNLCSLLTYANIEGFYYKPRIDYKQLLSHCEGLVISTACAGSFLTKLDDGVSFFYDLFDKMQDDLYLEVMPHKIQEQKEINKLAMSLSKKTGCKIIATNDCHYIEKKHWKAQEVLLAIQTKALWTDPKRWRFSIKNLHLRTAKEMLEALKKVGMGKRQYLSNTIEIAKKCCCFQISKQEVLLPRIKNLPLKVREPEFLMKLCIKGFHRIYGGYVGNNQIYNARLQEEFSLIVDKKFERVFLIVWELVNWCKSNKILVGAGRGSVAGSLVAFLLGITTVDPIKHDLLFSRFINKNRIDLPDIDIDFEDRKRYIVKQHLEAVYGEGHIANISSFNRMKAKGVIRDVSRVFSIPLNEVDSFAKLIEDNDEHTGIQEAINYHEEAKEFASNHPKIVEVAKILEGQVRNYSAHAAALIVSREPLVNSDRCNLIRRKVKNETTTLINWEKNNAEYVGLMKLDALGLKLLSVFSETIKLIKDNYDLNINIDKIDIEDKKVLKEINDGNTIGLFQLNTYAMTSLIKEMKIDRFKDLSDAMALVRPGPYHCIAADSLIHTWTGKKVRIDKIEVGRPIVSSSFVEGQGQRFVRNKIKKVIYTGRKIIFEIKTSNGQTIKASALHKFFVKKQRPAKHWWAKKIQYKKRGEWCTLRKIKIGDLIITRCQNPTNKKGTRHNKKLLRSGEKTRFQKGHIPWNKNNSNFLDYHHFSSVKSAIRKKWIRESYKAIRNNPEKFRQLQKHMKKLQVDRWKPKEKKAHSAIMEKYYSENPHPNSKGNYTSIPQIKIYRAIKKWFTDARFEYKYCCSSQKDKKKHYIFDIAIPNLHLDIEYDGTYWHKNSKEKEALRDNIIEKSGWKVIRVNEKNIDTFIKRIPYLYPHNNIKFSKVVSIKKLREALTYDLVMENQNFPNYIANNFIVHNSGMTEEYVKRKHGKRWNEQHIRYTKITKDTYGVIVYQEQVMEVINKMAGLPYSTADKIRKIIGKKRSKKEFTPYKRKFIKGCLKEKTFDKQEAEDFWTGLQEHAKYSFGKAHSTSYAILSVQSGWLKKYYPTEFICASLTFGSKIKKPLLIEEAYRLGLTLVLPKIGISDAIEWVARDRKLYIPFQEIKGVGPAKAKQATVMIPQNNIGDLFYTKKSNTVRKHKGSFGILLESIGAYKQHDNVQISEKIQSYFDFRIVTDLYNCYKNLYDFFKRKIRLDRIDKILNGDLKEIKKLNEIRPIVRRVTFKGHDNLMSCNDILRKECKAPVCPSPGKNNIVILGEAPGYEENEKGEGFIGGSGKLIWTTLDPYGYKRSDFHVTNVCKCFPSLSKTPNAKHIKTCNKFLKKELKEIKPKIILAFGNTSLNLFTGRSSGITNMSGKILWNEEYSSWIIFCLHPAATLHDSSRRPIFKQGIKSFLSMLKIAFKK